MILGSLTLSDHLTLHGLETAAPLVATVTRLIGGAAVVTTDGNAGGRLLRLNSASHLTLAEVEQLQTLFAAGQPLTMTHHRGSFTVLIVDMSDLAPDQDLADPEADSWHSGDIYLQEIA